MLIQCGNSSENYCIFDNSQISLEAFQTPSIHVTSVEWAVAFFIRSSPIEDLCNSRVRPFQKGRIPGWVPYKRVKF